MAELILFHHAQGLTDGCRAFANDLRAAGHVVHLPDLYDGRTFDSLEAGVAYAQQIAVIERGREAAAELPSDIVYAGMSLGVMPAQALAQTRPGARGALLLHGCVPPQELGAPWPDGLPAQIHTMADDDWGDVGPAKDLARAVPEAELFLYPGSRHLFTDSSLPDYDERAAALVLERSLSFLAGARPAPRSAR